jgi:hypothetical protein
LKNYQGIQITGKKNRDTKKYGGKELNIELIYELPTTVRDGADSAIID